MGAPDPATIDTVFYDGTCGLCHATVKFVVRRDPNGLFRFAPLGGAEFQKLVPPESRASLPDSFVVRRPDGALLLRSAAAFHVLRRLGGVWRFLGGAGAIVPGFLANAVYDFVASVRRRLFRTPDGACPLVPPELRDRFLD